MVREGMQVIHLIPQEFFFIFIIFFKPGDKTNCALLGVGKASLRSFVSFHGGVSQFYKVMVGGGGVVDDAVKFNILKLEWSSSQLWSSNDIVLDMLY